MWHASYTLDTASIAVTCRQAWQGERLDALWQALFTMRQRNHAHAHPTASLCFTTPDQAGTPPERVAVVQQSPRLNVWRTPTGFSLQCGDSFLNIDLAQSQGRGVLSDDFWQQSLLGQRDFLLLSVLMLLRPHGYYGLHANGVMRDGKGYLIVGGSGRGKTTLTISLVYAGWQFVADDALVLRQTATGIAALALRRSFACTPQTLARFPELARAAAAQPGGLDDKGVIALESLYPDRFIPNCVPGVLLFPRIAGEAHSRLVPLDATSAMATLLEQSAGIFTDHTAGVWHMAVLGQLLQQTRSYHLLAGRDVYEEPMALSHLLLEAAQGA